MTILTPVGRRDSTWWQNVRPLMAISYPVVVLVVGVIMVFGALGGLGTDYSQAGRPDLRTGVEMALLLPLGFSLFMGTYFFVWGRIMHGQSGKKI
jgi:hypothetical protein